MLKVENLSVSYGAIEAVKDVSIEIQDGQIVALIGANGAGKTTTLHAISGIVPIKTGKVFFDNIELTKLPSEKIVSKGVIQVPEGRRIFQNSTVEENLILGAYLRKDKDEIKIDLDYVYGLFPRLLERKKQLGGTLSGGEQQMLAMARALMSKPKIMLLDEPSMGLSPLLVKEIFSIIETINSQGVSILLVEQNAKMALSIANKAYVIETGKIVMSGTGQQLLNSDDIKKAYLGG